MSRLVMKFGGTSVANIERIRMSRAVGARSTRGNKVAVVVSAMAGKTNELVGLGQGRGQSGARNRPVMTSANMTRWWRPASR